MQRIFTLLLLFILSNTTYSQIYVGGYLGVAGYDGDLNEKAFKQLKPSIGATFVYPVTNRFNIRAGFVLSSLEGGDKFTGTPLLVQNRNLSFKTELTELSVVGELQAFDLNRKRWSPYAFGGIAFFHFNPYVLDDSSKKVFLKPLSTEGQGLAEYPDRKKYSLLQMSFPFGGGIKYVASDNLILSFEFGFRRTLTDYLDDVSTNYVNEKILFERKGAVAIRYAYRGDEVIGQIPGYPDNGYPEEGIQRGSSKYKDWYYLTGIHAVFRLPYGFGKRSTKEKKSLGCISSPM